MFYGGHGRGDQYGRGGRQNLRYRRSRSDARMVQCNNVTQIEVRPAYDLTTDKWFRLPESERIRIIEESIRYKRSSGNYNRTVVSKIKTGGVQDDIKLIQQRMSAIESNTGDGKSRASVSIMGGRN